MTEKTHKQRAIEKITFEISKDTNEVINIAKLSGMGEMLYYLHYLHFIRLMNVFIEIPEKNKEMMALYERQLTDAYKYIIQVLYKFSHTGIIEDQTNNSIINQKKTLFLTKVVLNINSKYESLSFFTLFDDIKVSGERDQFVELNMENVVKDERLNKFFMYAARTEREGKMQKDVIWTKDHFLSNFMEEYKPYADLFQKEFNISLEKFIELIDYILEYLVFQMKSKESQYILLEDGNVDIKAYGNILSIGESMFIEKSILLQKFGDRIEKIIERLCLKASDFDEYQLKYNLIARQPLLDYGEHLLVSPELLLDSLFVNSHYSLLESGDSREEYKKRYATKFVDKISDLGKRYGFEEVNRELELYEDKKQIGDIDLVLKNSAGHFILVEAKNHAIPMDVYFCDHLATEKRLDYLQKEWEAKVNKRKTHLKAHHSNYGIGAEFTYIIVSKSPEILSHFSDYLVLTLNEFYFWLSKEDLTLPFQVIIDDYYKMNDELYTPGQMEKMVSELNTGWSFHKP
jgi:hypothetical protein